MLCVYCQTNEATTSDHVPPKQLFRWQMFDNLLTVQSCVDCNNGLSADEEYFRNIVIGLLCHTPEAEILFDMKISRSFDRSPTQEDRMFSSLAVINDVVALDIDSGKINRIAIKIAQGLEVVVHKRSYPLLTEFNVSFTELDTPSNILSPFSPDFSYSVFEPNGWQFTFFDSVQFTVITK